MTLLVTAALALALLSAAAGAETPRGDKPYQIGAILHGGAYRDAVEGLRQGLRAAGLVEGRRWALEVRETRGDLAAVDEAARGLAWARVDLLYTLAGSVTRRVMRESGEIPIVFAVGSDPVALGLVRSLARPGGPLTGIHFLSTDLTAKRLQLLKEIVPGARRVLIFYDPGNKGAGAAAQIARGAAADLAVTLLERHVRSVEELRQAVQALQPGEADAFLFTADAMVASQAQVIIDGARAKRLPTMFHEQSLVSRGALASYGFSFREVGRMAAKYVMRIMAGARPHDLPVERVDRLELAINAGTARELGLTIAPSVLMRADEVIEPKGGTK